MSEPVYPMRVSAGAPETRPVIVARGYHDDDGKFTHAIGAVIGASPVNAIKATTAGEFWKWVASVEAGRRKLLILGDPNRDLALLGRDWPTMVWRNNAAVAEAAELAAVAEAGRGLIEWRPPEPGCGCEGLLWTEPMNRPLDSDGAFTGSLDGSRTAGLTTDHSAGVDILGIGNLHHHSVYTYELEAAEMVKWVTDYLSLIGSHDLGPRIESTVARQSMRSFRRLLHGRAVAQRGSGARRTFEMADHENRALFEFERRVLEAQSPMRVEPRNAGPFPTIYETDYTAHYLSVMATEPMPTRAHTYFPRGFDPTWVEVLSEQGKPMLADVVLDDGSRLLLTTPDLADVADRIVEVAEAATYVSSPAPAQWARHLFDVRCAVSGEMATAAKRIGVSLWGYIVRRNWRAELAPDSDYLIGPELTGLGRVGLNSGMRVEVDDDGNQCLTDHNAYKRERWVAFGAHMIAIGRRRVVDLIGRVPPEHFVASHTDSVWTTVPVPGLSDDGSQLGGVSVEEHHDVRWSGGVRYVGHRVDAMPGQRVQGSWRYHDFDDPRCSQGVAAWEVWH